MPPPAPQPMTIEQAGDAASTVLAAMMQRLTLALGAIATATLPHFATVSVHLEGGVEIGLTQSQGGIILAASRDQMTTTVTSKQSLDMTYTTGGCS